MATADELLVSGSSADKTLVIDNDLRMIKIPSSVKNLGVENDDDVLRLDFRMPRYLGETDLSTFEIRINYLNANGEGDVYTVSDMQIVGDNLTFSWLVGPTATAYKGNTTFNVCMKIVDSEGYIQKEYNTTIATLPVLEGLETEEGLVEYYSDILEQWKRELFGIGDTEETSMRAVSAEEQENIAQKGIEVLATIPEDYQTTYEMANNAYRTRANAIVSTERGEVIKLTDSSADPLRGLRVFGKTTQVTTTGKNLFDVTSALANQKRGTTAVSDYTAYGNGVRVTSNSYDHGRAYMYLTLEAGIYNISANVTVTNSWNFSVKNYDTNIELINDTRATAGAISYSFTLDTTSLVGFCFMSVISGGPSTIATNIQLELGSAATDYEPYSGGVTSPSPEWAQPLDNAESPSIGVYGRNLLDQNGEYESEYTNYVLNAVVDNGVISLSGTSMLGYGTLRTSIPLGVFKKGLTYRISRVTKNFHVGFWFYDKNNVNVGSLTTENNLAYTVPEYADHISFFYAGLTPEVEVNLTEKFMLNLGTEALPWEPCVSSQTLASTYILPGIPVESNGNYTDSNGQQWICDEIDFERGVYVQRIAMKVFDGTETTWRLHGDLLTFMVDWPGADGGWQLNHAKASHFVCSTEAYSNTIGYFAFDSKGLGYFATGHTTLDEFLTWLTENPVTVIAKLTTPIETELTAEELVAFGALHTNYPNTTILNDAGAGMEVKYNEDLKFYASEIMEDAAETVITQDKIQAAVDAWLSAHYSTAEGVSF